MVSNAAAAYIASDFLASSSAHINAFIFADCGTGTGSALVTDTTLGTPAGTARVSGTQSNPSSNVYKNVATIAFTSTLAITEYSLFTASSAGTMLGRSVFAAINVNSGDSIAFQFSLTITAG